MPDILPTVNSLRPPVYEPTARKQGALLIRDGSSATRAPPPVLGTPCPLTGPRTVVGGKSGECLQDSLRAPPGAAGRPARSHLSRRKTDRKDRRRGGSKRLGRKRPGREERAVRSHHQEAFFGRECSGTEQEGKSSNVLSAVPPLG